MASTHLSLHAPPASSDSDLRLDVTDRQTDSDTLQQHALPATSDSDQCLDVTDKQAVAHCNDTLHWRHQTVTSALPVLSL